MKYTPEKVDEYLQTPQAYADRRFRSTFHFDAPAGWINNPHGLIFHDGWYHLFYQYNPYSTKHENIHWGHALTKGLIHFRPLTPALAPEVENGETDCYAGTCIENPHDPSELLLMYTMHQVIERPDGTKYVQEAQRIARSHDGIHFVRDPKPCLTVKDLPEEASETHFRDPDLFYRDGWFYAIVASQDLSTGLGQFLVYRSVNLESFEYFCKIGPSPMFGTMAECPNFFALDGKDVLIYSAVGMPKLGRRFNNVSSSLYATGHLDLERKKFFIERFDEIDSGSAFYAPQTVLDDKGRRIMFAWMDMWDKTHYTANPQDNWAGSFTCPRELHIKGDRLFCTPVTEFGPNNEAPFFDKTSFAKKVDISFRTKGMFKLTFMDSNFPEKGFVIGLDEDGIYLDDSKTLNPVGRRYTKRLYPHGCPVRILIDTTSVEIFVNDGECSITSRVFTPSRHLNLITNGVGTNDIEIKEIQA